MKISDAMKFVYVFIFAKAKSLLFRR